MIILHFINQHKRKKMMSKTYAPDAQWFNIAQSWNTDWWIVE